MHECIQHAHQVKPGAACRYADDMQTNGTTFVSNGTFYNYGPGAYVPTPAGTYQPWWDMWFRYAQNAILSRSIPTLTASLSTMSTIG